MDGYVLPMIISAATVLCCGLAGRATPMEATWTGAVVSHHRVRRGWIWNELSVEEEDSVLRVIGKLQSDFDMGDSRIQYILSGDGAGEIFDIDEHTGEIHSLQTLDREEKASYVLRAQALDRRTGQPVEPESEFIIKVKDINDNAPVFQNEPYVSSIPEMCPMGTTVVQVTATDADDPLAGNNAKLLYSILQGEPYFSVEPKTGVIVTSWPNMDREALDRYLVVVEVKDMLGIDGGHSATTTVTVTLSDVNDNGPTFQQRVYTFTVLETARVGTEVGVVMAEDSDIGANANVKYSLEDLEESSTFVIQTNPVTQEGVILLAEPLDYETKRRFVIAVEAINDPVDTRFLNEYEFSDRATVKIIVEDVDEPPVFSAPIYEWKVPENAAVGTLVGTITARDTDTTNNPVRYSIIHSSDVWRAFTIETYNGSVTVARALDRETADWHNMTIAATETRPSRLSSSVELVIRVLDVNDNTPRLHGDYRPYVCEGAPAGEVIQLLSATDPDAPPEGHHFYFSMVPDAATNPNFTIRDNQDNTAGILTRRSSFSRKHGAHYVLPVVVTDNDSPALSSTTTLTIRVCGCQPAGHCPASGGVEAFALSMGLSVPSMVAILLVCLATLAGLLILTLAVRRVQQAKQAKMAADELDTLEYTEKVFQHTEPQGDQNQGLPAQTVPLRPHPRRRERRLRREEVAASIRMSLRNSHLIGPEDEVFRQFIMERLEEADRDPHAPPFDCLCTYAFEGAGSPTGSLSSLESFTMETGFDGPRDSTPRFLRLTPWLGAAEEETSF